MHTTTHNTFHTLHLPARPSLLALLTLLSLSLFLQSCFGNPPNQQPPTTHTINVHSSFTGTFYLALNGNLYVLNGSTHSTRTLVHSGNAMDPAISPDGRWLAFIAKYKNYSDLCVIPSTGGPIRVLRSGNGSFYNASGPIHNTFFWYAQPSWSPDGSKLLFLSDLQKDDWYRQTGQDAPLLDLQVFSIPFSNPSTSPTPVAYATFGDGGDQLPSYRPHHPDQIIYTHYTYDAATRTQQQIQLYMEDPDAISSHPGLYYPGSPGGGYDPAIAITPTTSTITDPAFSPDGNAIAYIKTDSDNRSELAIMPTPPSNITLTPNNPTTERLALESFSSSSHLLTATYLSHPVWSPDGKHLAYYDYTNNTFNLWLANINYNPKTARYTIQGRPTQLTSDGIDSASSPSWSP